MDCNTKLQTVENRKVSDAKLPSGRTVALRTGDGCEAIEVLSQDGAVEVTIRFTAEGPEVRLSSARLTLDAETIELRCRDFDLKAIGRAGIEGGEVAIESLSTARIKSPGDLGLEGGRILLNCEKK